MQTWGGFLCSSEKNYEAVYHDEFVLISNENGTKFGYTMFLLHNFVIYMIFFVSENGINHAKKNSMTSYQFMHLGKFSGDSL